MAPTDQDEELNPLELGEDAEVMSEDDVKGNDEYMFTMDAEKGDEGSGIQKRRINNSMCLPDRRP